MDRFITIAAADWGPALHRAARLIGAVLALLFTLASIAAECAYDLGRQLRLALEARNDQLAAAWVAVLGLAREEGEAAAAVVAPASIVTSFEPIVTTSAPIITSPTPIITSRRRRPRPRRRAPLTGPRAKLLSCLQEGDW